ncbi:MAG: hypothetical protein IT280_10655 [Ignavibacteria bacterium]|nr:hypothetical protein [Ignavibacteria bacterium]
MPKKNIKAGQIKKIPEKIHNFKILYNAVMPLIFLIMIILITTFNISGDDDIFWHLETGKYITLHKVIPSTDVFGLTTSSNEWVPFEWGFDFLFYNVYSLGGYTAISILRSLIFAIIFYLLFRLTQKLKLNYGVTGIIMLLLTAGLFERLLIKPQIISYLLTTVILYIFLSYSIAKRSDAKLIFLLPVIFLIWANMHMGVLLGLVLFFLFIISELIQLKFTLTNTNNTDPVTKSNLIKLLIIFVCSIAAIFINPFGIKTYIYVYNHLQMKMINEVYEWYSPFNKLFEGSMYIYIYYTFLFLSLIGIFIALRNKLIFPLISLIVFLIFSFRSTRYSIDFMLISSIFLLIVFSYAAVFLKNSFFNKPYTAVFTLVIAFLAIILLPGNNLYTMFNYNRVFGTSVDKVYYPVNAVEFIRKNNIINFESRIFNSFGIGGYLIWNFNGVRNFIDSRNLNDDIYFTYKMINNKQHGFEQKFNSLNFDVVFWYYQKLPWNKSELNTSILSYLFKNSDVWKLVYWDDDAFVFVKNTEKYKDIIEKYEYKYAIPYFYTYDKEPLKAALVNDPVGVTNEIKRNLKENPDGIFIRAMAKSFGVSAQ